MKVSIITLKKEKIVDFAKERNLLLEKSDADWILFLDTDEVLSDKLKEEIKNLNPNDEVNGYYIPRRGFVEEKLLRLGRKGAGRWERFVHEVWRVRGKVGYLKNPIIHNEDINILGMVKKANFYSTLHAKANKKENKKATLFKIIFFPIFKFIQTFVKSRHFVFSLMQSFHSFLSWSKLYFLHS